MLDSIGSVKDVFNPQENTQQAKAIKEAEKPLKKIQDEVRISTNTISGLGQWRTHLENFESNISEFTYNFLRKNGVFDSKKVVAPEDLTKNYAEIKAKPGTTNQQIPFEIQSIAKSEILASKNTFNPDAKFAKEVSNIATADTITLTVPDNGLKAERNNLFSGKFTIGNSKEIEVIDTDTLLDIAKKINNVTKQAGEEKNPHVIASVEKDTSNKEYLWIRSDEKHHGIQNKFAISGTITNFNFQTKNQEIAVDFDDKITVSDFVVRLRNNAKKADIEVLYNPQLDSSGKKTGTIILKSLLTGTGNDIKISHSTDVNSLFYKSSPAQDAQIKVDGQEITSKTNKIETDNLFINLLNTPSQVNGKDQIFNLSVQNDTEGLVEKFEALAKSYNELAKFVGTNSLQVEGDDIPKPAEIAALYSYRDQLNYINETIYNAFNKLNQFNRYGDDSSKFGITIKKTDYTPPPGKAESGERQVYMPIEISEMVIDKVKLQNALDENFDTFKNIVSYKFESTNENFKLNNNHKNVDLEVSRIKNLDYYIDYSKVQYFNNISKETNSATNKINANMGAKKSFILNNVKIDVDSNMSYSSLVDEINKYSSQTNIKAYLLGENSGDYKITPTDHPVGSKFKIALSSADDTNIDAGDPKKVQDNLRYSLNLADPENALNDIFKSSSADLDNGTTQHPLVDGKIPTIISYNTSKMVTVTANLEDNTQVTLPSYFVLGNNNNL
ncbi:MAG: flagellar filament capping protein FliD, partial [Rickettsiales bacterium]|nr:flagellar filament capping protein FliD [Rickettsiales bacterium]